MPNDGSSIPSRSKDRYLETDRRATHPPVQWLLQTLSLRSKQPDREANPSPSYSAEIKNVETLLLITPYAFTVWCL